MTTIPLLTTEGGAHDRGRAHGARFAGDIAANIETYLRRFEASGLTRAAAFAEAARWRTAIALQNGAYAEEMAGIARGSGQSEDMIALLNARYELAFTLLGQEASKGVASKGVACEGLASGGEASKQEATQRALLEIGPDGCTTFGLLPEVTADRHTWLGQNWDWLEGVHGHTFVLRARRSDKPGFVCLTEAGIAGGKMGMNECGIGLVENGLASSHDGRHPYQTPFHTRCREVLDAERHEDALRPVTGTPRTCSANFLIGAAGGRVVDIETSPDHVSELHPQDGIVTHSNHFLASGHGVSLLEKVAPNTLYRANRMRRLLQGNGAVISLAHMRAAAADHFGAPYAICRHPDPAQPAARRTMTVGAVLIDLEARTMHVANGPPCANAYVAFTV